MKIENKLKLNLNNDTELLLFKYLWIIIIMPKFAQFFIYFFVCINACFKQKLYLDKSMIFIIIGILSQGIAIMTQVVLYDVDKIRLMAALNTLLIWIISIFLYSISKHKLINIEYILKISKYMCINSCILFVVYLFSLIYPYNVVSFFNYSLTLKRYDYLSTGVTTRFCGFMETVLCIGHFFCMANPLSVLYVNTLKRNFFKILFSIMSFIPVIACHSRISLVICSIILCIELYYLCYTNCKKYIKIINLIIILIIIFCIVYCLINIYDILNIFQNLFNSRQGSNSARFLIYKKSIEKTLIESPIIGIGIKYMLGDFPYGSHCTYIGLFYKSGLIGFICYLIGLFCIFRNLFLSTKNSKLVKFIPKAYIMYLLFLIFSDIDASNWVICSWFILWGSIISFGINHKNI